MPASSRDTRSGILIYLLCTFSLSVLFSALILRAGVFSADGGLYALGLMWCPALAALITCGARGRSLGAVGWQWASEHHGLSIGLPLLYGSATYAVVWLAGLGGFPNQAFITRAANDLGLGDLPALTVVVVSVLLSVTVGVIRGATAALGEEIGWRGFLVPELFRVTSFTGTALISGVAWAAWSVPVMMLLNYDNRPVGWFGILCGTVTMLALGVLLAWVRLRSGSLWPAVTLHAAHTVIVQSILTPLTIPGERSVYAIGNFGAGLAIAVSVVAVLAWRRRHGLERSRVDARRALGAPIHDVLIRSALPHGARGH